MGLASYLSHSHTTSSQRGLLVSYSHSGVYETTIIISASTTSWSDILPHFNAGREVGRLFSVGRYGFRIITPPVSMAPAQILPLTPPYCLEL